MRPDPFLFTRAKSLDDALAARHAGAVILAGGQALLPSLNLHQASPEAVVDISGLSELAGIDVGDDQVRIGALTTLACIIASGAIGRQLPDVAEAAARTGDVQVRGRATLGGNLAWADPRANLLVALSAANAVVEIAAGQRRSTLPVEALASGFRRNALGKGMILAVRVPIAADRYAGYVEISRQKQDLALVNVAVVLWGNPVVRASVIFGGLADTPLRAPSVERALIGRPLASLAEYDPEPAFQSFATTPRDDQHASAGYRRSVAAVALRRVLDQVSTRII